MSRANTKRHPTRLRGRPSSVRRTTALRTALLLACLLCVVPLPMRPAQDHEILVAAAISLKESFNEIGRLYEQRTGDRVTFTFGSSGELEKQIEAGAPLDVFASAGEREMDQLQSKSLIEPGSRADFVRNSLVLIVPVDSKLGLRSVPELANGNVQRIALGDPKTVPAGIYARELLEKTNLWSQVESRLIYAENVRQVLDYVMRGEADAGLVYATDVPVAGGRVAIAARPPDSDYGPVLYPIAVVKGSAHQRAAKAFVDLVLSQEGSGILKKHGFLAVK